jgi:hypothetical protein
MYLTSFPYDEGDHHYGLGLPALPMIEKRKEKKV